MEEEQINVQQHLKEKIDFSCRSLGKAIFDSEEHKKFIESRDKFRLDELAKEASRKYNEALREYKMKIQFGIASEEDRKELEELRTAMLSYKTFSDYYSSQYNLLNLLKELNSYISSQLKFDFASFAKPAGGCCA